jgi:hypothetical protein
MIVNDSLHLSNWNSILECTPHKVHGAHNIVVASLCNLTLLSKCGSSEYNSGDLGARLRSKSPCTTFQASNFYIPRAHWTSTKCWVMLWNIIGFLLPFSSL